MHLSPDLIHLAVTIVFSFLVGLELKTYHYQVHPNKTKFFFGTTRTYTFVGILGFLFYNLDPTHLTVYIAVLLAFTLLFSLLYYQKIKEGSSSILSYVVLLLIYSVGPMTEIYPLWMPALVFVLIVFILNAKQPLQHLSKSINMAEFETLGKMVLLSAVILPLLPKNNVIPYLPISPFKLWMAVVVISGISYAGYLMQKYLFPSKGYFLTGIVGGTYSSTATTVVLARKTKNMATHSVITAAIMAATAMMYLRLIIVAFVFNVDIAKALLLPFIFLSLLGMLIALFYLKIGKHKEVQSDFVDRNPLELGTAFLFALLFVIMMLATNFVMQHYGNGGLKLLSFAVGFTDIDPFVLSILTGKYSVASAELISAVMIAAGSNNILKALYALWFGGFKGGIHSAVWLGVLGMLTIGYGLWI